MEYRSLSMCGDRLLARPRQCSMALLFRSSIITQHARSINTGPTIVQHGNRKRRHIAESNIIIRHATTLSQRAPTVTVKQQPGQQDLDGLHARAQELSSSVLKPTDGPVPAEQRILYVLEQLEVMAKSLADAKSIANAASMSGSSATSALLGSVNTRKTPQMINKATLLNLISQRAEQIVRHPNVFMTPAILQTYVQLQNVLHQPASFADVFELYAIKPTPTAGSGTEVTFSKANPSSMKSAVDQYTADTALSAAIRAHNLTLALDIIETSFAAPAYARAKIVRKGAIPGTAFALAPLLAYGISTQFSQWQTMLEPSKATMMAFAGIMTYLATVGSMGYIAITTANDQMDRVTWAQGVPLWERWVREEERAALDRVAAAWGFKSLEKRGDEEGEDWEVLRETCGCKGMVLDKVELMEGME